MSDIVNDILADLRDALRSVEALAAVTLGEDVLASQSPRAAIALVGLEDQRADDDLDRTWRTLTARVRVTAVATESVARLGRAVQLSSQARAAVMADPTRGGRCCELPIGPATQLGPAKVDESVPAPALCIHFDVFCRFEQ